MARPRWPVSPACGDHRRLILASYEADGSPPRVWGPPPLPVSAHSSRRFTPTRVGTTAANPRTAGPATVHPHACGDHGDPDADRMLDSRFTPTRVGTTHGPEIAEGKTPVHPHACGDHHTAASLGHSEIGSPPRVWGPRHDLLDLHPGHRFTPTRVGTTADGVAGEGCREVHPHACGDHRGPSTLPGANAGSPPRVWGPRQSVNIKGCVVRFTPTRVGTTTHGHHDPERAPVHPHACGDHTETVLHNNTDCNVTPGSAPVSAQASAPRSPRGIDWARPRGGTRTLVRCSWCTA